MVSRRDVESRAAAMYLTKRSTIQRVVTLALQVLDRAAYGSAQKQVACPEVRLALAVLWCILPEKSSLELYWHKANHVSRRPWESCREAYYRIAQDCREEGWHAPVGQEEQPL